MEALVVLEGHKQPVPRIGERRACSQPSAQPHQSEAAPQPQRDSSPAVRMQGCANPEEPVGGPLDADR